MLNQLFLSQEYNDTIVAFLISVREELVNGLIGGRPVNGVDISNEVRGRIKAIDEIINLPKMLHKMDEIVKKFRKEGA